MFLSELGNRQVVNIRTGCLIGYICDVKIDISIGRISHIVIVTIGRLCGLLKGEKFMICWENIRKIGEDFILVDIKDDCLISVDEKRSRLTLK